MIQDNGYYPGGGMLSSDHNIFYLNIPKNASTYLTNILKTNNWDHWDILKNNKCIKTSIAFIRDPVDRWISGFATYAAFRLFGYGYGSDHFLADYNDLVQKLIFDQIIFDDHTDLQVKYLEQISNFNPIYFRYNNSLISQLNSFLGYELDIPNSIENNSSENNYDTKQVSDFMRRKLNDNPDLKARIINCYQQDYAFINKIEFYNDPR